MIYKVKAFELHNNRIKNNLINTIMKKLFLALFSLLVLTASANAMSYEQAKDQALFLTDKMAYELNLTDDQYEAAYEVNLDYLININNNDDIYGDYWQQRNEDMEYILQRYQYSSYLDCLYFYRPLYWGEGYWHFRIYSRYPRRNYFYFGRPSFYVSYRGGHSWRMNGGRSWYSGRNFGPGRSNGEMGMQDRFNRGDYGRGNTFGNGRNTRGVQNNSAFGSRNSSYQNNRTNVRDQGRFGNGQNSNNSQSRFGNNRSNSTYNRSDTGNFGTRQSSTRETVRRSGSFGNRNSTTRTVPSNTFAPRSNSNNNSGSSFRSNSSQNRSSSSNNNRNFGSGNSNNGGGSHFGHR